jgi:lysophospholipase
MVSPFGILTTHDNTSLRYGVWPCETASRRGAVILLNGRTEFMEKHAETISDLKRRDFDVCSFDWRGQGLSSRMLTNRHKGFVRTYQDYINDLEEFVEKIVKPRSRPPLVLMAHSMGGHIALRYLHDHAGSIDRAVLISPMIDIFTSSFTRQIARFITRFAHKAGWDQVYSIGSGDYSPDKEKFEGNLLTSDTVRFMDKIRAVKQNPELALGGVTYGWLAASFESIDILTSLAFAGKIKIPILMVNAGSDKIVSVSAQQSMCSKLRQCRSIVIPGARHEILKETDAIRSIFWNEFDQFTADIVQ